MLFSTLFTTLLATTPLIAALPSGMGPSSAWLDSITRRDSEILRTGIASCNLDKAPLPQAPTPLPPVSPGLVLAHVALGRGTQNYTCAPGNATAPPKPLGAVATLFNVTCMAAQPGSPIAYLPQIALALPIPQSLRSNDNVQMLTSGHHDFLNNGTPYFNLNTDRHGFGDVQCKKNAAADAPQDAPKGYNGLGSVAWLKLDGVVGKYKEVYRVNTAGGMAPKTCEGMPEVFEVEYATNYYFYAPKE